MLRDYGLRFYVTNSGTTSATATKPAETGVTHYITDISASSDKAGAVIQVKDGTTVIWKAVIGANSSYEHSFAVPLAGTKGNSVSITIDGTSICTANIAGFSL